MKGKPVATLIYVPIVAYVAVLLLVAVLVRPPALGWIGLGVVAAVSFGIGTLGLVVSTRLRTNADRRHPHAGAVYRLLVVLDGDVEPGELVSAVRLRRVARHAEIRVVAPVLSGPFHFFANDEDLERDRARRRLHAALHSLAEAGVRAQGVVGADDPLQALGDALERFRADEILLVAGLPSRRGWLDRDFERRARDLYGIPVTTVFGGRRRDPSRALARDVTAR